ncbi:MAG: hypothetical protein WAW17_09400 [Rhodococcus sp. (in: high G+C Gram-positive bacteria)]|uniref:hypothetical protein n=1 Tax=Rhodococcus sp. TaxID=1831 RepID=UPI003BB10F39
MNDDHAQLVAELRALAESALDRLEPLLQRAASPRAAEDTVPAAAGPDTDPAAAGPGTASWSGCTWCPVCALAAVILGEQHDLVTLLATQASVLVTVLRQILDEHGAHDSPDPGGPPPSGAEPAGARANAGAGFLPISVTVKQ